MNHIIAIDGGSPEYWRKRKHGFRLIRDLEQAGARMLAAPLYLCGGYDADGDPIVIENIAPYDAIDEALRLLLDDDTAVGILVAQRRTTIAGVRIDKVAAKVANGI